MSIGDIDTEAALREFVRQEVDRHRIGTLVRQLQGSRILGQFTFPFTLAAGTGNTFNGAGGVDLASLPPWIPVGAIEYTPPVAGQNRVSWAYGLSGNPAAPVEIALYNDHTIAVSGTFNFYLLAE